MGEAAGDGGALGAKPATFSSMEPGAGLRPLLAIGGLSKTFGSTRALEQVSLRVMPGTVQGLVGQNGSGKSTLVKILAGYHEPDPGASIVVGGSAVTMPLAGGRSHELGLRFVHQDLGIVADLSVTENLFIDRFVSERQYLLRWSREHSRAAALLGSFGVEVDPRRRIGDLPPATQAMVVIVRAAEGLRGSEAGDADRPRRGILILDEATAALPLAARRQLLAVVREVVALGHGVLFISHFPDEVLEWADQVTVLRDGQVVAERSTVGMAEEELVELIIGRKLERIDATPASARAIEAGRPVLRVTGLRGAEVAALDFAVRPGEVLGITGLVGSGFDEVCRLIGGAAPARGGMLEVGGRSWQLEAFNPYTARRAGISLVPSDRQREGVAPSLTVAENISLSIIDHHRGVGGRIKHRELSQEVARLLDEYEVRPPDFKASIGTLSGGNQQKVVIAKAMAGRPRALILIEPTQGVDVGSSADILGKLRKVARGGTAVVCGTTDAGQLELLCDRVLVLQRGRLVSELTGNDINEDRIVEETYRSVA